MPRLRRRRCRCGNFASGESGGGPKFKFKIEELIYFSLSDTQLCEWRLASPPALPPSSPFTREGKSSCIVIQKRRRHPIALTVLKTSSASCRMETLDQLYLWKTLILVGLWTVADGCVRKSVGKRCLKGNQTLSGFQFGSNPRSGGKHVVRPPIRP